MDELKSRLDELKYVLEQHFQQDASGFSNLVAKLDRMDDKLDLHLERITRVEEQAKHHTGQIKLILSIIVSAISAAGAWVARHLFN